MFVTTVHAFSRFQVTWVRTLDFICIRIRIVVRSRLRFDLCFVAHSCTPSICTLVFLVLATSGLPNLLKHTDPLPQVFSGRPVHRLFTHEYPLTGTVATRNTCCNDHHIGRYSIQSGSGRGSRTFHTSKARLHPTRSSA